MPPTERIAREAITPDIERVRLSYGYMDQPDLPADLLSDPVIARAPGSTSFFIGRDSVGAAKGQGMPFCQDIIFLFLQKNATDPTQFFQLPPNRVVELGSRVKV